MFSLLICAGMASVYLFADPYDTYVVPGTAEAGMRRNASAQTICAHLNSTAGADHTSGTVDVYYHNNSSFISLGSAVHQNLSAGIWCADLSAEASNYDLVKVLWKSTGAITLLQTYPTTGWDDNATIPAVNVTQVNGTTQTGRDLGAGVNVTHVSGTAQTGGDLYAMAVDIDNEVDAIKVAVEGIAVTGAALNALATSSTHTSGSVTGGTYESTFLDNATYHAFLADGGSANARLIDHYYEFTLPNTTAVPTQVKIVGYVKESGAAGGDSILLRAWNGTGWETLDPGIFPGSIAGSPPDLTSIHALFSRFVFADSGQKVRIGIYSDSLEDNTTVNIDQIYISYAEAISANVTSILSNTNTTNAHLVGTVEAGSHLNSTAQAAAINTALSAAHGNGSWDATAAGSPAPSAVDVAAEVWNTIAASHTAGSTMGGVLNDAPTAGEIDTQLSGTHGNGSWDATAAGSPAPTVEQIDAELSGKHGPGPWVK